MRRVVLFIVLVVLPTMGFSAPRLKTADKSHPVGIWRVQFANGVIQTSENKMDGPAWVTEPGRTSPGKWNVENGAIIIRFDDDRLERWTKVENGWKVEHWCPSRAFPEGSPEVGVAGSVR